MRYVNWKDVVDRYPKAASVAGADTVGSAFIYGAEAAIDAKLATIYTVPFCSTPSLCPDIIRDIATDLAYYRMSWMQMPTEQASRLSKDIDARLDGLADGSLSIVSSGTVLATISLGTWGTHLSKPNVTGTDDVEAWAFSDNEMDAESDKRDL